MIAGIIPSPSTWDPADNADMAKSALQACAEHHAGGMVTSLPSSTLMPSSCRPPRWRSRTNTRGRTVICWIWCAASWCSPRPLPKRDLDTGGYKIITTIDKSKQDLMQSIGDTRLDDMPESLQIGGIALDPKTGEVLSVYAGSDYLSKRLNNADQARIRTGFDYEPFALLGPRNPASASIRCSTAIPTSTSPAWIKR